MQAQRHRPVGITILAVLAGITFVVNSFVALLYLGVLPVVLIGGTGFFGEALLAAVLWGIMALIWGWVAAGLWTLNPQAWLFVVILSILNLVLTVVSVLGGTTWEAVLPSLLVNAAILIYSLTPGVKEAFESPDRTT